MSKPEPKLTHMPEQIKQLITDLATTNDMQTKLSLGLVCHEFRNYLEKSPMKYTEVAITLHNEKVVVRLSAIFMFKYPDGSDTARTRKLLAEFYPHENGVMKKNRKLSEWRKYDFWEKVIPGDDYRKSAVQYALELMGRPKTVVDKFVLKGFETYGLREYLNKFEESRGVIMDEMERIVKEFRNRLFVTRLQLDWQVDDSHIWQILPFLEPGTLVEIRSTMEVDRRKERPFLNLDLISETDQWKQAKKVCLPYYKCSLPFEKWENFEEVELYLDRLPTLALTIVQKFIERPMCKKLDITCKEEFEKEGVADYWRGLRQDGKVKIASEPNINFHIQINWSYITRSP